MRARRQRERRMNAKTCLGVRVPRDRLNLVSAIKFRCSSSVPRPFFDGLTPLPDDPWNLRLLFIRFNPPWLLSLPLLFRILLRWGLRKSSCDESWTLNPDPFGVIPVTRIMFVGRLRIVGIGNGSSPCWARAVNDSAHNFLRTPAWRNSKLNWVIIFRLYSKLPT